MRILIVDDDENVASGIRMALTLRGYDADVCGSAEEALERLQTKSLAPGHLRSAAAGHRWTTPAATCG